MKLEKRQYNVLDTLSIPFKIAPLLLILQMVLYLVKALVETVALAMATAYFIDTAMLIFQNKAALETIYIPFLMLLIMIGIMSIMGSVLELLNARIKYALENHLTPVLLERQARLS